MLSLTRPMTIAPGFAATRCPAPMAHPADTSLSPSATTDYPSATSDYPDGLGATESKGTNGRTTATSPR